MTTAIIRTTLVRLGISVNAARFIVDEQGIDDETSLLDLTDDEIEAICKVCRKPHVIIHGVSHANGVPISFKHQTAFKILLFLVKFKQMTSRGLDLPGINRESLIPMRSFRDEILATKDPETDKAPKLESSKIFEFFTDFRDYLHDHLGAISRRPLSYVIRTNIDVPDSEDDVGYDNPESKYNSYLNEIEHRAPIQTITQGRTVYDPDYIRDNIAVWKLLWAIVKETNYVTHVKVYLSKQDGRSAYQKLYNALLGPQAIDNHASKAENKLQTLAFDGTRRKNWDFDKYVQAHKEQHILLESLADHGYYGIDERSKVRHFLKGITDAGLLPVKSMLSCLKTTTTFDEVVESFRNFIETNKTVQKNNQVVISEVGTPSGSKGSAEGDHYVAGKDYSSHSVEVRYYKRSEWKQLTPGNRNYIREHKRKKSLASNGSQESKANKRRIAALEATVSSLAGSIAGDSPPDVVDVPQDAASQASTRSSKRKRLRSKKRGDDIS